MPVLKTNNITNAKFNSTEVSAVYRGSARIWRKPPILAPINLQPEPGEETTRYCYWALHSWDEEEERAQGVEGYGSNSSRKPFINLFTYNNPATGQQGKVDVDGWTYKSYSTGLNDFADNPSCEWLINMKINFLASGWTHEFKILRGGIDDPINPPVRDDRFPEMSNFYTVDESEIADG